MGNSSCGHVLQLWSYWPAYKSCRVISLVTDEDGILSSAIIDNDLWTSNETEIRQVISDAQFGIEVDMSIEGLHPDHNVHNMGDLASWLSSVEQFR